MIHRKEWLHYIVWKIKKWFKTRKSNFLKV
jgi:hypothetical protein